MTDKKPTSTIEIRSEIARYLADETSSHPAEMEIAHRMVERLK